MKRKSSKAEEFATKQSNFITIMAREFLDDQSQTKAQ